MSFFVLIPCSGQKADLERFEQKSAGEIYTGSFHRYARNKAEQLGATPIIVSALHGIISLDEPIADYNQTIDEAESAGAGLPHLTTRTRHQAEALGLLEDDATVWSFLPKKYAHHVARAGVGFDDILAGSRGIGEQRGRIAALADLNTPTTSEQLSLFPERTTA